MALRVAYSEREYAGMLAKIFAMADHGDIDRRTTSIFSRSRGFSVERARSEDLCWHVPESDGDKRSTPQRERRLPSIRDTIDFLLEQWMK